MRDRFGRRINYLRISVIDRCNLRCRYCMPVEGLTFHRRKEILTYEEITELVQVANTLGIDRARLTGGEPLVRAELYKLVRMLKRETDLVELSLTTNGLLLERFAEELAEAGLDRVNVSLDSLKPERFLRITRFGDLDGVLRGIARAAEVGLEPVKVNTLLLRGFNDDEVEDFLKLTLHHDLAVRFLELMPIGRGASFDFDGDGSGCFPFQSATEVKERLIRRFGLVPVKTVQGNGPAKYWRVPGAAGAVGFITPLSDPYCGSCNRMRLTSNGQIRPCLAYDTHIDLKAAIRRGDRAAVRAGLLEAARIKPRGHGWTAGQVTQTAMSRLGG